MRTLRIENAELFEVVQLWVDENYGGLLASEIVVVLDDGRRARLPMPVPRMKRDACGEPEDTPEAAQPAARPAQPPFVPNAVQKAILAALDGKALRSTTLGELVGDRARVFRKPKGGMQELRDRGLVDHHERLGYFRPDAPPPELSG